MGVNQHPLACFLGSSPIPDFPPSYLPYSFCPVTCGSAVSRCLVTRLPLLSVPAFQRYLTCHVSCGDAVSMPPSHAFLCYYLMFQRLPVQLAIGRRASRGQLSSPGPSWPNTVPDQNLAGAREPPS